MASVYRKSYTKPLPKNAEFFTRKGQQFARWRPEKKPGGKPRTAKVTTGKNGELRIRIEAETYTAKYRDGSGIVQETATGCRTKDAAQSVLNELLSRAERVRSGLVSSADNAAMDHQHTPLSDALADYLDHLRAKDRSATHVADCKRLAERAFRECKFNTLRELAGEPLERWLAQLTDSGSSPRTRNSYLQAVGGFCRWCVEMRRLSADPTERVAKANEATDQRRNRRSLSATELQRLLYVARIRPLAERGRETVASKAPKGRATWKLAPLTFDTLPAAAERARQKLVEKPEYVAELELLGRERALIYKVLVLTGLRRGELASLKFGSLLLDAPMPCLILEAGSAKNRQRSEIPLREDVATDLAEWVADRRDTFSGRSGVTGEVLNIESAIGGTIPAETPLFNVPKQLVKTLDRDLAAAGIAKADDRGRTVDVHAIRHTYGSLLSAGGVSPRTAQAAMRHSSIDMTMNVYTDPRVLDVAGALDSLPSLPLDAKPTEDHRALATGTDDRHEDEQTSGRPLAPTLAPNSGKGSRSGATTDNWARKTLCVEQRTKTTKQSVLPEKPSDADGNRTRNLRIDSPVL